MNDLYSDLKVEYITYDPGGIYDSHGQKSQYVWNKEQTDFHDYSDYDENLYLSCRQSAIYMSPKRHILPKCLQGQRSIKNRKIHKSTGSIPIEPHHRNYNNKYFPSTRNNSSAVATFSTRPGSCPPSLSPEKEDLRKESPDLREIIIQDDDSDQEDDGNCHLISYFHHIQDNFSTKSRLNSNKGKIKYSSVEFIPNRKEATSLQENNKRTTNRQIESKIIKRDQAYLDQSSNKPISANLTSNSRSEKDSEWQIVGKPNRTRNDKYYKKRYRKRKKGGNPFSRINQRIDPGGKIVRRKDNIQYCFVKNINWKQTLPPRAGVIIYTHYKNEILFGLGIDLKYGNITDFGGQVSYTHDNNAVAGGLREFNEETHGIFGNFNQDQVRNCRVAIRNDMMIIFVRLNIYPVIASKEFLKAAKDSPEREIQEIIWLDQFSFLDLIQERKIMTRNRKRNNRKFTNSDKSVPIYHKREKNFSSTTQNTIEIYELLGDFLGQLYDTIQDFTEKL